MSKLSAVQICLRIQQCALGFSGRCTSAGAEALAEYLIGQELDHVLEREHEQAVASDWSDALQGQRRHQEPKHGNGGGQDLRPPRTVRLVAVTTIRASEDRPS